MLIPTDREANVLRQLVNDDRYGLQLACGSDGIISRNVIYMLLGRMESKDLVVGRLRATPKGERGPRRRVYSLTKIGRASLSAYAAAAEAMRKGRR